MACGAISRDTDSMARNATEPAMKAPCISPAKRLGLAVAEAVLGIGRRQGVADGQQIDGGGEDVERGIGQRRHHRDRVR